MKFTDDVYLNNDPFSGSDRDVDIRCHTFKIVKVRKTHPCFLADLIGNKPHEIPIGKKAKYDSALVDGEWERYYTCLDCMDKWLIEEVGIEPKQDGGVSL